jgi:hypothetical protein
MTTKCYKVVSVQNGKRVSAMASLLPQDWIEEYGEGKRTEARRGLLMAFVDLTGACLFERNYDTDPGEVWEAEAEGAVPILMSHLVSYPCSSETLAAFWVNPNEQVSLRRFGAGVIGALAITLVRRIEQEVVE